MPTKTQIHISNALGVNTLSTPMEFVDQIHDFLCDYIRLSRMSGFVLGVSGGQDSTLCGALAQMAVSSLNRTGFNTSLHCIRLPYGVQADANDAELAMAFIKPSNAMIYNIKPEVDQVVENYSKTFEKPMSDFAKGNVKARARMVIQYAYAAEHNLLVLGTDHAAEAVTGFYTKFGDGAADLTPLSGLTKRQGRAILEALGCPPGLYNKVPTADLEDGKPLLPDEEALGLSYNDIDDYLELKDVSAEVAQKIENWYKKTEHKRNLPATIMDKWWY